MSVSKAIILSTLAVASATDELKAIADKINSIEGATWRAEKSSRFNSVEEIKRLLGVSGFEFVVICFGSGV